MTDQEVSADEMLDEAASQIQQALAQDAEEAVEEEAEVVEEDSEAIKAVEDTEEYEEDVEEEVDPVEAAEMDKARKAGWRPLDEYKGDPKYWKDYKEFNKVGDRIASKLSSKIENLTAQNKQQQDMIKKLIKAQGAIAKQAHDEAITKLKAERRDAIEMGDADAVEIIDEKIKVAKDTQPDLDVDDTPEPPPIDDAVQEFIESEKSWFNDNNPQMMKYAIAIESGEREAGETDSEVVMQRVKEAVMRRFPDKFDTPRPRKRPRQPAVETGSRPVRGGKALKMTDLPAEARQIAEYFEKNGVMSKQDYLQQYKEGLV